jgi:CRP-like cAMP-binding protein
VIDGEDRRALPKRSFFGEIPVLLHEPASASVVARRRVSRLILPSAKRRAFLVSHPLVVYRMLRVEARRLKTAPAWRT